MIKGKRNILVAIHLQPYCNFLKFGLKMIDTYILYLQNQLYIQFSPRKDAQCGFGLSNCDSVT